MNALTQFNQHKETIPADQFVNYCKRVIAEKQNYAKIVVQKAQQFLYG